MTKKTICGGLAAAGAALLIAACSGGSSSPTTPSTPTPTPTPTSGGTTITITSSGVSPKSLTVAVGTQVTFVNNDSRAHVVNSNPHPEHTDCPPINDVGFLNSGQSKQTGNLTVSRTCGYHDHELPTDARWQGTITIQ